MSNQNYSAKDIKVYKGLDHVRKRPAMYTEIDDPTHIGQEVIDNATDEILANFASQCDVTIHSDGSMSVTDNGRGIPVDMHPEEKVSAAEVIFTQMNSGGKFEKEGKDSAYQFSGGLHGVGVTVTNALSHKVEVTVKKDGKIHYLEFNEGTTNKEKGAKTAVQIVGECDPSETGTVVRFYPNAKYFDSPLFNVERLKRLLKGKAVLLANSVINFKVEESEDYKAFEETWSFVEGLKDYLTAQLDKTDHTSVYSDEMYITNEDDYANFNESEGIKWAVSFVRHGGNYRESYVNLVPTKSGGTHVAGFERGVFEAIKLFASRNALVPKGVELRRDDATSRMSYILSANVLDPAFKGQTKEQLHNKEIANLSELCIKANLDNWLQNNYEVGVEIAEIAVANAQARIKSEKTIVVRKTNSIVAPLPDKLSDCTSKNPMDREVFIVEGDSAGGSAKQGRCRITQAIMPLKGKPQNTWNKTLEDVLGSEEIADLSTVLGVKPHTLEDDPEEILKKLRYRLAIVLADADIDGHHITVLVTGVIVKHFPFLITHGHFAICQTPLYRVEAKKKGKLKGGKFYVQDDKEKDKLIKKLVNKGYDESKMSVSRFKGLGEMNPDQLSETALSPDTRTLIIPEMDADGIVELRKRLDPLLCKKRSDDRKEWIEREGDFEKFDY
ncbi:ATP-binding protein [Vibrio crassostreae]|uniref:ATP-binding protein n=1 Tax=Vibrio crassostreae TaxID=246167 RepID=UPI001B309B55|nr:ATP-binding protein [Vibrio crassostreae]